MFVLNHSVNYVVSLNTAVAAICTEKLLTKDKNHNKSAHIGDCSYGEVNVLFLRDANTQETTSLTRLLGVSSLYVFKSYVLQQTASFSSHSHTIQTGSKTQS